MNTVTSAPSNNTQDARGERVLLICPPYQNPAVSSMSVVLLASYLKSQGISCEEAYLNIDFSVILGRKKYDNIITTGEGKWRGPTAELLFAEAIHGPIRDTEMERSLSALVGTVGERRAMIERFKRVVEARIRFERPQLVGITTSFNQLLAAVWMTRIIKAVDPKITVVFGGTACEPPMGETIAEAYPEVDYVVSGYGELPLVSLSRGERPTERVLRSVVPVDLEALPVPEYRPYIRAFCAHYPSDDVHLMFLTSRGCWWGHKRHCAFCGLNGEKMGYQAMSSERALGDIRTLWERHRCNMVAADSILSREHLKTLVPLLGGFQERPSILYEMKANVTEEDVKALARARIIVQAGIESLSSHLLKLMQKGLTTIRALALLKWSREQQVFVAWNQLCRIPGETKADYDAQIDLMKKIPHFTPPNRVLPVVIDRYSPYFNEYQSYGWEAIEPVPVYSAAHPHLGKAAMLRLAHHFEGVGGVSSDAYLESFEASVDEWKKRHVRGDGLFWSRLDGLSRVTAKKEEPLPVSPQASAVIEATHRIVSVKRVMEETRCDTAMLHKMVDLGFLFIERDNVINLTARTGDT